MSTKKSKEFQQELAGLIDAIESDTLVGSERVRISEILRANTTDSPCMVHAEADEPVFPIRAADPIGAEVVALWAMKAGLHHEPEKITGALGISDHMEMWRRDYLLRKARKADADV